MKEKIIEMLLDNKTYSEIVEEVGCSKPTICYHARKLGIPKQTKFRYNWSEVRKYHETHGVNQTIAHFGMSNRTWEKAIFRGDIKSRGRKIIPLQDLLVDNRPQTARSHLKERLLKAGIFEYKCFICGIVDWLGNPLSLHLDHKNGKHKDNRLENIWLLCPNCHDQQPTSNGKNKPYKNIPE